MKFIQHIIYRISQFYATVKTSGHLVAATKAALFILHKITPVACSGDFAKFKNTKPSDVKHYLSIVAIIKNEASYIAEWIEYHLLVGVEKFYIYDNESDDNLRDILEQYIINGIVKYKYYQGKSKQIIAYNDVLEIAKKETYWLAIIDCDEFIVPISTYTIPEFLKDFEKYVGVEINWVEYGSSGKKFKEDGLVIDRFKRHSMLESQVNRHVKTICNPRAVARIDCVHTAIYFEGKYSVNANKEENNKFFLDRNAVFDKIRINHYFTKSYEEYLLKRNRGRADLVELRNIEDFFYFDKNDIYDPVMDKYIAVLIDKF